jgi:hypothetical protein
MVDRCRPAGAVWGRLKRRRAPRPRRNLNELGARRVIKYSIFYPFRLAHPAPVHSPAASDLARWIPCAVGESNSRQGRHVSVVQHLLGAAHGWGKGFLIPVRQTERGVWWWAPPLRSAKRGGLRTTLTAGDATGHPMGPRKVGASWRARTNRLDGRIGAGDHPRPATGHDATRRGPPRPRRRLTGGCGPGCFRVSLTSNEHVRPGRWFPLVSPGQGPNPTALHRWIRLTSTSGVM